MSIRESMNEHPGIVTGVVVAIIVVALVFLTLQFRSGGPDTSKSYYTDDDGASYFADTNLKAVPFPHGGKEAVIAHVFQCGKDKPKVFYMERFSKEVRDKLQQVLDKKQQPPGDLRAEMNHSLEVKRPGETAWVKVDDPQGGSGDVSVAKCPDGTMAVPVSP